jgi:hypothetical protein
MPRLIQAAVHIQPSIFFFWLEMGLAWILPSERELVHAPTSISRNGSDGSFRITALGVARSMQAPVALEQPGAQLIQMIATLSQITGYLVVD